MMGALSARNALRAARGERIPFVLCYHGVGSVDPADDPHGLMVSRELFERHLDLVAERGHRLVTLDTLWERVQDGVDADGLGAITFDDGLAGTLETVAAILRPRGLTASAFIPTGLLGKPHPDLPAGLRIVDRGQLRELARLDLEIGSHAVDHADLRTLDYGQALDQLRRSKETLEDIIGRRVTTLAYPFGRYTRATMAAAREAGYRCACASEPVPWQAYAIPRDSVYPSTSPLRLKLKLAGLWGPGYTLAALRGRVRARWT